MRCYEALHIDRLGWKTVQEPQSLGHWAAIRETRAMAAWIVRALCIGLQRLLCETSRLFADEVTAICGRISTVWDLHEGALCHMETGTDALTEQERGVRTLSQAAWPVKHTLEHITGCLYAVSDAETRHPPHRVPVRVRCQPAKSELRARQDTYWPVPR